MKELRPYGKKLILTTLLTCFPILIGLLLWNHLPDTVATHFGTNSAPDGWSSKAFAVIGLPLFLTVIHLFAVTVTLHDPKRKNIGTKLLALIFWTVPAVSMVCCLSTYAYALGIPVDIGRIVSLLVGAVFILLGNYMSKNHQNYTVGIRLPWTLDSAENWNRTHRLASVLWILAGIVFLANSFFQCTFVTFAVTAAAAIVPMAYSFFLHTKGI